MNDLMRFLTSKEIIIVYIVSIMACLLVFIIYLVEKNNAKLRQKHNTKELNKLVEQVKEETEEDENTSIIYEEPVLEQIEGVNEASSVVEMIDVISSDTDGEIKSDVQPILNEQIELQESNENVTTEIIMEEPIIIEEVGDTNFEDNDEEQLEYTSIEPDQETARLELRKLVDELKKQEKLEKQEELEVQSEVEEKTEVFETVDKNSEETEVENIKLTNYEEEQEENAIISLEELLKKSKEIYESNELTQYMDEGNEPISLEELEKTIGQRKENIEEPFIIENVVDERVDVPNEIVETKTVTLNEVNRVTENKAENKKFKSSPIISPIYGIEKSENSDTDIQLENTANYDKFDEEIKKTNEFLMTLKELQHKLD